MNDDFKRGYISPLQSISFDMINVYSFKNFYDYSEFIKLKKRFLMLDVNFNEDNELNINLDFIEKLSYEVLEKKIDTISSSDNPTYDEEVNHKLRTISFQDYTSDLIKSMTHYYIGKIETNRKIKGIYSQQGILGYYIEKDNELAETIVNLNEASFLPDGIRRMLIDKALEIKDYLQDKSTQLEYTDIKIPFTLKLEDLSILFARLYQYDYISNKINVSDLAKILSTTVYHSKDKNVTSTVRNKINKYRKPNSISDRKRRELKNLVLTIFQ